MHSLRLPFLVLFCLVTLPGSAQKFTPKTITFTGYPDASQADLLTASGLKPSTPLSPEDLQAAAQKLNDTGLFAKVNYKYDGQQLTYEIEPSTSLLPVRFDNFVWLNTAEIDRLLRAKLPLYKGRVAAGSGLEQQVTDQLTALAAEQHLSASIVVVPVINETTRQTTAERFQIASPPVTVSELTLDGASAQEQAKLDVVAKAAVGEAFSLSVTPGELMTAIANVYHNDGYLDAKVTAVSNQQPTFSASRISVPVTATIVEGAQYRIGKLTLDGSVLMSPEEFQKRALLKSGDLADQELLRKTLQLVAGPYVTRGYLRAKIAAVPKQDESAHIVDYVIHVEPGDQYHMGKVQLLNITDAQRSKFLAAWKMNAGDAYDASYPSSFLVKNHAALRELDGYSAGYKQYEHEDTHIVDLVVSFQHGGALQ